MDFNEISVGQCEKLNELSDIEFVIERGRITCMKEKSAPCEER
jgi:hypothetical protein